MISRSLARDGRTVYQNGIKEETSHSKAAFSLDSNMGLTYDTTGGIMDQDKIKEWRASLADLRRRLGNIRYDDIISFAKSLWPYTGIWKFATGLSMSFAAEYEIIVDSLSSKGNEKRNRTRCIKGFGRGY